MAAADVESPEGITHHEETVLLFRNDDEEEGWYGDSFDVILEDVKSEVEPENLTISVRNDGLDRIDDRSELLWNSTWVIWEDCLTEDGCYDQFYPYLLHCPVPHHTRVTCCVEDSNKEDVKEKMTEIYPGAHIVDSQEKLTASLETYFLEASPDLGHAGREKIYDWIVSVREVIENYD